MWVIWAYIGLATAAVILFWLIVWEATGKVEKGGGGE